MFTFENGRIVSRVPGQPVQDLGPAPRDGASAYEVWLAAGHTGSQSDFLASLRQPAMTIAVDDSGCVTLGNVEYTLDADGCVNLGS